MPENFNPVRDAQPGPYVQSLLSFLEEHTAGPNFKIYDWLRTLDFDMLAATDSLMCSIFDILISRATLTAPVRDFIDAACLAAGAERPAASPESIVDQLAQLLEQFNNATHTELDARAGYVIVTERIGIWPSEQRGYQVTQRGRAEAQMSD
jgi:hypothetical protein